MKGTRRDVLLQLERWSNDEQDKRVFWLNGLAGTGKSTITQTFAEMSFFCSRDFNDRSNLRTISPPSPSSLLTGTHTSERSYFRS